jgi:uncharacterized phage infection (PIP) family protein YhgE
MRHALVVIAVLALAGCGGSSPTGSDDSYAENLAAALGGVQQPAALDSDGLSALFRPITVKPRRDWGG